MRGDGGSSAMDLILLSPRRLMAFVGACALVGGIIGWFTCGEIDSEV